MRDPAICFSAETAPLWPNMILHMPHALQECAPHFGSNHPKTLATVATWNMWAACITCCEDDLHRAHTTPSRTRMIARLRTATLPVCKIPPAGVLRAVDAGAGDSSRAVSPAATSALASSGTTTPPAPLITWLRLPAASTNAADNSMAPRSSRCPATASLRCLVRRPGFGLSVRGAMVLRCF